MRRYLIQVRDRVSSDSSHRVFRFTLEANDLDELIDILNDKGWSQCFIDILHSEDLNRTTKNEN